MHVHLAMDGSEEALEGSGDLHEYQHGHTGRTLYETVGVCHELPPHTQSLTVEGIAPIQHSITLVHPHYALQLS